MKYETLRQIHESTFVLGLGRPNIINPLQSQLEAGFGKNVDNEPVDDVDAEIGDDMDSEPDTEMGDEEIDGDEEMGPEIDSEIDDEEPMDDETPSGPDDMGDEKNLSFKLGQDADIEDIGSSDDEMDDDTGLDGEDMDDDDDMADLSDDSEMSDLGDEESVDDRHADTEDLLARMSAYMGKYMKKESQEETAYTDMKVDVPANPQPGQPGFAPFARFGLSSENQSKINESKSNYPSFTAWMQKKS